MPKFKFETGWSYWLFGDPSKNVPPFQFLKASEFQDKTSRGRFRGYCSVMKKVEMEVKKTHPNLNFKKDLKQLVLLQMWKT